MSDDLCFDRSWSLSLPQKPELEPIPPHRIRADDRFEQQLYLESFTQISPNKSLGILAQAVESEDGKSAIFHKIFEKNIPTPNIDQTDQEFFIDQIASKLYLVFRGTKEDRRGEYPFHLSVSPLSFGEPDKFGHRRFTLSDEPGQMYKINFGAAVILASNIFPHPRTGELLFYVVSQGSNVQLTGKLDLNAAHSRTIDAQVTDKTKHAMHVCVVDSFRFLAKDTSFAAFHWSFRNLKLNCSQPEEALVQFYSVDGGQLKLERDAYCDQRDLAATISPAEANRSALVWGSGGIVFRGHIFKYTVFACVDGVALMKNFHTWVESGLDHSKTRRCFLSFKTAHLFREIQLEGEEILVQYVLGSTLYYTVEQSSLHRLDLGDHFKDYRTCAYCGIKETNKRRNDNRKRIANFKVCRNCKQLNLHHQWWKFPCHFCSDECVKKGWREHKKIHVG